MKSALNYGLVAVACIALSACGGKSKAPTGQVVATVDGDEITLTELRAELQGVNLPDPAARKAAEQRALDMIISRKIVAKAATEQKLDKTPEFALQEERALDNLRAETLQQTILKSVPAPTKDEAARYMTNNPEFFAERKILTLDQLRVPGRPDAKVLKTLEPLKTLPEVEAALTAAGVKYQRGQQKLDVLRVQPELVKEILKLPPGEIFVLPANGGMLINEIKGTEVVPFTGDTASQFALNFLKTQREREAIGKQLTSLIQKGKAEVQYNPQYAPPKPKAPAAKAAAPAPKA